jgi:hypothetical protein
MDLIRAQIDNYTVRAKTEIAARASDHVAAVRDLRAEKEETERKIQNEREREGDMLASKLTCIVQLSGEHEAWGLSAET